MRFRLLRLFLGFSAFAWGVSLFGVFLPWSSAALILEGLGARQLLFDPMLDYWLRMASGAFSLVGFVYLLAALRPRRFAALIPVLGLIMLIEGAILLIHGLRLQLPALPFCADVAACFAGGAGILACRSAIDPPAGQHHIEQETGGSPD